jgi:hypothetical protein
MRPRDFARAPVFGTGFLAVASYTFFQFSASRRAGAGRRAAASRFPSEFLNEY